MDEPLVHWPPRARAGLGLLVGEVAGGHPAGLAVDDDLDAVTVLAAGDEDLLEALDEADVAGVAVGARPQVELGRRPEPGVGAPDGPERGLLLLAGLPLGLRALAGRPGAPPARASARAS